MVYFRNKKFGKMRLLIFLIFIIVHVIQGGLESISTNSYLSYSLFATMLTYCNGVREAYQMRVIGGNDTLIIEYPSFVLLLYKFRPKWLVYCGGSYIKTFWVLTAAHCVTRSTNRRLLKDVTKIVLRMGMSSLNDTYQERRAARLITHPEYPSPQTKTQHDVGLIKIDRPFPLTARIRLAGTVNRFPFGSDVTVIGFGSLTSDKSTAVASFRLQKIDLSVTESTEKYLVCNDPKARGACFGDSGGPMYLRHRRTQVGIVSRGNCKTGMGIYVNIFDYREWIEEVTGQRNVADPEDEEENRAASWRHLTFWGLLVRLFIGVLLGVT